MADNVAITAGSGTSVATDDVSGVHYQRIKIVDGTADSSTAVVASAAKGLYVDPRTSTSLIQVTPTISTSQYTAKDALGDVMTFANAARASGEGGLLESVTVVDKAQQLATIDLALFSATVSGVTDNAVFDPADSDLLNCVGVIPISGGDWSDFNDNSLATRAGLGLAYKCAATSLFGILIARSAPTYVSTSDISVTIGVVPD